MSALPLFFFFKEASSKNIPILNLMLFNFQSNDPNMKTSQAITKFLPLMIGYFALSVPSGLSLYW